MAGYQGIIKDGYGARPASGSPADLVREAAYVKTSWWQHFEVVKFFQVAVADVTPRLVAFPD